jgi:hypothetical protein
MATKKNAHGGAMGIRASAKIIGEIYFDPTTDRVTRR